MTHDPDIAALLQAYPVTIDVPIWWGDQDAFGHVNNTIPLRWFESARIAFMGQVGLSALFASHRVGPILASMTVDYRRQLHFPDAVVVGARVAKIGRTSLTMEHVAVSRAHRVVAVEGKSTIIVFDYAANRPEPVPQAIRDAIANLQDLPSPGTSASHLPL